MTSYLSRPRIAFFGKDAMTDPSTANNENVVHLLDYAAVELINPPQLDSSNEVVLPKMSDAGYRDWMTSPMAFSQRSPDAAATELTVWNPTMPGYWNYWGGHLTTFGTAEVTSVALDGDEWPAVGNPTVLGKGDPLMGARVVFNAKIVDPNPGDTYCSLFVVAGFSVIVTVGDGAPVEVLRGSPTTSGTRWLNFYRPGGAGTFQAVIPNDTLTFDPDFTSPGLTALRDGAASAGPHGGLLLRWCFYGMETRRDAMAMYDEFQKGGKSSNPKYGGVIGSLGIWDNSEMMSMPVGRILHQPQRQPGGAALAPAPRVKSHEDVEVVSSPVALATTTAVDWPRKMGLAAAVVEGGRMLLDLNTAFPEDPGDPHDGQFGFKHDFGVVRVWFDEHAGPEIDYHREAYQTYGGVWEVSSPEADTSRALSLRADKVKLLVETPGAVMVATDDQALYLQAPAGDMHAKVTVEVGRGRRPLPVTGQALPSHGKVSLRLFAGGVPVDPAAMGPFTVQLWHDEQLPGIVNSLNPLVVTATSITETYQQSQRLAGGPVTFDPLAPGCYKLRFLTGAAASADSQTPLPNWATEDFSVIRVLPADAELGETADDDVTLEFVYETVLKYYAILYPVMSKIIPWGPSNTPHDPDRVAQFAALIKMAVDETHLGTALEMPITRELSAGKRKLLRRWCDLQLLGRPSIPLTEPT